MPEKISEAQLQLRLPEREKRLIKKAAAIAGLKMSEYIRLVMNQISIGIVLSKDDDDVIVMADSLKAAIKLKAYKLGELIGESFTGIDDEKPPKGKE